MTPFLFALPWLGVLLFVRFVARVPTELPEAASGAFGQGDRGRSGAPPSVSVIVPARNEMLNIETCIRSISSSDYPDFEIIVVDDRSEDATADLARALPAQNARRIVVIEGAPLPDGWLGKPWACHQGYAVSTGAVVLFTDADTVHGRTLLKRSILGRQEESADLLTVVGRQLMESFWERLVQPQIFLAMLFRFPNFERSVRNGRWRDAIANGQYLLFLRGAYEAIGGHEAVKDEVVEDLVLAQLTKRFGLRLRIRSAETDFATRMYRSLGQLVEGWSKNLVIGGLQSVPRLVRPLVAPLAFVAGILLWLLPPITLLAFAAGWVADWGADVGQWSAVVCALSAVTWVLFSQRMGTPARYGLLYPLGAAVGSYILLRSWVRGRNVEWKGRRYRVRPRSEWA